MPPRPFVERHLNRLIGHVRNADPGSLAAKNPRAFMDEIQVQLGQLHGALVEGYFRV
jgi:hypothetical protein